jgi:type IV secretion system protein VirB9
MSNEHKTKLTASLSHCSRKRNRELRFNNVYRALVFAAMLTCAALQAFPAHAQAQRTFVYKPDAIYAVNAGLGVATQIVLDPSEKIKDFGTGFSAGWEIVRRDHIFYLKPKDPDAETNMYIRTDRRSYMFDLKIVTKDWKRIDEARAAGVAYLIQFTYPDANDYTNPLEKTLPPSIPPAQATIVKEIAPVVPASTPYQSYHMEYDYSADEGSKWLTPVRVYDDGQVTYVQMNQNANTPVFFGRSSDRGEEFLLNKTVKKNLYILHGIYPFIIIRNGTSVVGIRRR